MTIYKYTKKLCNIIRENFLAIKHLVHLVSERQARRSLVPDHILGDIERQTGISSTRHDIHPSRAGAGRGIAVLQVRARDSHGRRSAQRAGEHEVEVGECASAWVLAVAGVRARDESPVCVGNVGGDGQRGGSGVEVEIDGCGTREDVTARPELNALRHPLALVPGAGVGDGDLSQVAAVLGGVGVAEVDEAGVVQLEGGAEDRVGDVGLEAFHEGALRIWADGVLDAKSKTHWTVGIPGTRATTAILQIIADSEWHAGNAGTANVYCVLGCWSRGS
jgi:hypothetical protein